MNITPGTRIITAPRDGKPSVTGTVALRDASASGTSLLITVDPWCGPVTASGTLRIHEDQVAPLVKPLPADDVFTEYTPADGADTASLIDTAAEVYDVEVWNCNDAHGLNYPIPTTEAAEKVSINLQMGADRIEHNHRGTVRLCFDAFSTITLTPRHA